MPNPDLTAFLGTWQVERRIDDARAASRTPLRFTGTLRCTPDPACAAATGLICDEEGRLHLPDRPPLTATRRTLWRTPPATTPAAPAAAIPAATPPAAPPEIDVFFADGRFFHRIPAGGHEARHDCAPDLYLLRYDFAAFPLWTLDIRVTGPRKDYAARTRYSPLHPAPASP